MSLRQKRLEVLEGLHQGRTIREKSVEVRWSEVLKDVKEHGSDALMNGQ